MGSIPKVVQQESVKMEPLPATNFDYDEEEYIYYDEWIPIDANNENSRI